MTSSEPLKRTPLFDRHVALGARMVEFGGWEMPVQYSGIVDEHAAVRQAAGLFDISHMGEVEVRGPDALAFLQHIATQDVATIGEGLSNYSLMCRPDGGIVDDIFIYHLPDRYMVVVNASNADKDFAWMQENAQGLDAKVENVSDRYAQIALQGPRSEQILKKLTDTDLSAIKYYRFTTGRVDGVDAIISRTGYTGEDGFEVYVASERGGALYKRILEAGEEFGILPAGLGARDTLRLEAKMALYGNDIDHTTTPLEADLGWIVKLDKGTFNGADVLQREKAEGVKRKLVGFEMIDRGIARHGYPIVQDGKEIGVVTSGTHSPTLKKAIGLAYLPPELSAVGSEFNVLIRNKETKARVVATPFYKRAK